MALRLLLTGGLLALASAAVLQARSEQAWSAEQQRENARSAGLVANVVRPDVRPSPAGPLRNPATILAEHPLTDLPLLRAGLDAAASGDSASARALINEAARRNPRSASARTFLVVDAIRRQDRRGALRQADRMLALRPEQSNNYFPLLAELARDPALQDELGRMVKANIWGSAFLSFLTAKSGDAGLVFQLTNAANTTQKGNGWISGQQAALIQSLIDRGDFDRAYLSWVNFLPQSALGETGLIYDGSFKGLPGPAPFNWRLIGGDAANVTIERGAGLNIDYHGETAAQFAEQVLLLEPRSYRLSFSATGDPAGDAGKQVLLHVYCLPGRTVLTELPINPAHPGAAEFTVPPASCPAQLLAIEGSPGEFPAQRQVALRQLALAPVGAVP